MNRRQEALEQALVLAMERKDKKEVVFVDLGARLAETGLDKFIDCNVSSMRLVSFHCFVWSVCGCSGDPQHQRSQRACYSSQKVQSAGSNPRGLVCRFETVCVSVSSGLDGSVFG